MRVLPPPVITPGTPPPGDADSANMATGTVATGTAADEPDAAVLPPEAGDAATSSFTPAPDSSSDPATIPASSVTVAETPLLKICAGGATDVGQVREVNEDSILVDEGLGLYVVADGMGGHAAGEVASGMAVKLIGDAVRTWPNGTDADIPSALRAALDATHAAIYNAAQRNPAHAGMGTTVVAVLIRDDKAYLAHVGDSRVYLLRNGLLIRQTKDHSVVQVKLDTGEFSLEEA